MNPNPYRHYQFLMDKAAAMPVGSLPKTALSAAKAAIAPKSLMPKAIAPPRPITTPKPMTPPVPPAPMGPAGLKTAAEADLPYRIDHPYVSMLEPQAKGVLAGAAVGAAIRGVRSQGNPQAMLGGAAAGVGAGLLGGYVVGVKDHYQDRQKYEKAHGDLPLALRHPYLLEAGMSAAGQHLGGPLAGAAMAYGGSPLIHHHAKQEYLTNLRQSAAAAAADLPPEKEANMATRPDPQPLPVPPAAPETDGPPPVHTQPVEPPLPVPTAPPQAADELPVEGQELAAQYGIAPHLHQHLVNRPGGVADQVRQMHSHLHEAGIDLHDEDKERLFREVYHREASKHMSLTNRPSGEGD